MPKTKLQSGSVPEWLMSVDELSNFDRNLVLTDSIYYPGSNIDGRFLEVYLGMSHSIVYADPGVPKEIFRVNVEKIGGYELIVCKDVSSIELSPSPKYQDRPLPSDFYPELNSHTEVNKALREAYRQLTWSFRVSPFAMWAVLQRKSTTSATHGPERFSLLFIGGEGIATYSAIYNSNLLYPKAIVFKGADIGFGHNWTFFEKKGGLFERVVMSNEAGIPKYLLAWDRYNPSGSDHWVTKEGVELYWERYTEKIPDNGDLNVWTKKD
ncbi:hypothetical protein [Polynucleobacter kasalickyi]|uniref:Uncharacterized protein n=1 Tax=Polynucleobacter kasalickyi TaxID=1938817 RepID=A0A1W2CEV4_9BURK|nr:hypothetical protein [Polynucleobacter kasalickyi]SMC83775.1 hypothetical protein SAMN06296008_1236 [Polynucleobacter kasalickyi]